MNYQEICLFSFTQRGQIANSAAHGGINTECAPLMRVPQRYPFLVFLKKTKRHDYRDKDFYF